MMFGFVRSRGGGAEGGCGVANGASGPNVHVLV